MDTGEKDFRLYPILVLLMDALLRAARATAVVERRDLLVELVAWHPDARGQANLGGAPPITHEGVLPGLEAPHVDQIPPLRRDMVLPLFGGEVQMRVG